MRTLRHVTDHKIGLPAVPLLLKIGAALIGTEPELVLKSRWVLPTKLIETGFQFKYIQLEDALRVVIQKMRRKRYHLF